MINRIAQYDTPTPNTPTAGIQFLTQAELLVVHQNIVSMTEAVTKLDPERTDPALFMTLNGEGDLRRCIAAVIRSGMHGDHEQKQWALTELGKDAYRKGWAVVAITLVVEGWCEEVTPDKWRFTAEDHTALCKAISVVTMDCRQELFAGSLSWRKTDDDGRLLPATFSEPTTTMTDRMLKYFWQGYTGAAHVG
jgi:hypothetical protein